MGFSYVEQALASGEKVITKAEFHWIYMLKAWLVLLLLWWMLGLGVAVFFMMLIYKWTTEVAVTDRRVIYKRGWIARKTDELSLSRIEEVNFEQGVFGRIFNYGQIRLGGVGTGAIVLPNCIARPLDFKKAIEEAKLAQTSGAR